MQRFRFPVAVALTSVVVLAVVFVAGGLLVGSVLASGAFGGAGMAWRGGPPWTWAADHGGWHGGALPPELAGLADVPAAERFAHFQGVQLQLTDKDNRPLTVRAAAGTATAVSPTSLTIAGNDGSTRTFALDDRTAIHARRNTSATGTPTDIHQDDRVVVVTLNGASAATAVLVVEPNGFGPH